MSCLLSWYSSLSWGCFLCVYSLTLGLNALARHAPWLLRVPMPTKHAFSDLETQLFALLHLVAPKPRPVLPSEKTYITSSPSNSAYVTFPPRPLPCWHDRWLAERHLSESQAPGSGDPTTHAGSIEPAEVLLSVVFPAYNEQDRIIPTLQEAVDYLDLYVGRPGRGGPAIKDPPDTKESPAIKDSPARKHRRRAADAGAEGYEIIIVNDGSTDKTVDVVLKFAKRRDLHDVLRIVSLERNRGKGGGVTHGMRHVRGEYVLFADADGASRFSDVEKLIEGCEEVADGSHRGVAVGSRAHLVGSDAVVKVSRRICCHFFSCLS